jgi:hypothetical protein
MSLGPLGLGVVIDHVSMPTGLVTIGAIGLAGLILALRLQAR